MDLLETLLKEARELNAHYILQAKPDGDITLGVKAEINGKWYGDFLTLPKWKQDDRGIYETLYNLEVSITTTRQLLLEAKEEEE